MRMRSSASQCVRGWVHTQTNTYANSTTNTMHHYRFSRATAVCLRLYYIRFRACINLPTHTHTHPMLQCVCQCARDSDRLRLAALRAKLRSSLINSLKHEIASVFIILKTHQETQHSTARPIRIDPLQLSAINQSLCYTALLCFAIPIQQPAVSLSPPYET